MDYTQARAYLQSFQKFGWLFGRLERISALLSALGNPHHDLSFLHIAGTNGKGSTAAICAEILKASGYRVGLFVSPYVRQFEERFQINGEMISRAELVSLVEQIQPAIEQVYQQNITITEFEVLTVLGLLYFADPAHRCDVVCLETGLGGGDDATNVIPPPLCSIITSISMDHTAILGDSIAEIASHKAGIIKPHTPCVCYASQHPDALAVIQKRCGEQQSPLILPDLGELSIQSTDAHGSTFLYRGTRFHLALPGEHQVQNALSAIEAMGILQGLGYHITTEHLVTGLENVRFPARFQQISTDPLVIADIAHNKESMEGLCATLALIPGEKVFLLGMLAEKDLHGAIALLAEQAKQIICVTPQNPRAVSGADLCEIARTYAPACAIDDYPSAYREALRLASETPQTTVVICGSFFVMEEMLRVIDGLNP